MAVLRRIFHMVGVEGESLGEVQRTLRREGVPSAQGGGWPRSTLRYLILNELYLPRRPEELEGLVPAGVLAGLDPDSVYGLWTWNKSRQTRWRERGEDGKYRRRVHNEHRPREEWSGVPVCLDGSGLERPVVESARERVHERARRTPSQRRRRLWLLSGGIARCALCGNAMSPHTTHQGGKVREYYRCYNRYNYGLDYCANGRSNQAPALEEAVWHAVRRLIAQPERLMEQYEAYLQRRREGLRSDPDREARELTKRLHALDEERRGYLRQNARGVISDTDLDAMLAELDSQHRETRKALDKVQDEQRALASLQSARERMFDQFAWIASKSLDNTWPEERRKILEALRITVEVDENRDARIRGVFDADITQFLPFDDKTYRIIISRERVERHKGFVSIDSGGRSTSSPRLQRMP